MVPAGGDGSQYRQQLAATTKTTPRISLDWAVVNAQFWSAQQSTRTMSHQDENFLAATKMSRRYNLDGRGMS